MLTGWKAFAENTGYRVADKYIKKTGGKGKMVKKIENRNIDVTKARGELEEDLMEYVYRPIRAHSKDLTSFAACSLPHQIISR